MISKTVRTSLAASVVAMYFLAVPAESQAIFHWLSRCCGGNTATTPTYGAAPAYSAAAPADPCCAPPQISQTVNYVPQTCYRTQYVNVPVTTYRPVVSRDPCTGCPVTCMRPATSYVQQARMVPYTSYRMVVSNPCCGSAPAATTAGYTPLFGALFSGRASAPAASCSGCSAAAAPISYAPAATTPYYGTPTSGTIINSPGVAPSGTPTIAPPVDGGSTPTFDPAAKQNMQKPIPKVKDEAPADETPADDGTTSGTGTILSPRLFQPNDRTTSYPILRARVYRPVTYNEPISQPAPTAPPQRPADNDDWRPSTR
jgi:hypothetical protein